MTVRDQRTRADWAQEIEHLLRYAEAQQVILVCDNLNTHGKGASYEILSPEKAPHLVKQLDFCHTPHGSRLNIAKCELSAMTVNASQAPLPRDRTNPRRNHGMVFPRWRFQELTVHQS